MSEDVRQKLEQLRTETQADSLAEVVRRALAVYDYLWTQKSAGANLLVKDEDGVRELVLL